MQRKRMNKPEFAKVADREWVPVALVGDGLPRWMRSIPEDILKYVLASGTYIDPRIVELHGRKYADVVGGIDVYREDPKDIAKGYSINKDHYIIVLDPKDDSALLINGPLRDNEHWLEEDPDLPEDILVIETEQD